MLKIFKAAFWILPLSQNIEFLIFTIYVQTFPSWFSVFSAFATHFMFSITDALSTDK